MNINYPDSPIYPNLAKLWLEASTSENQDTHTKHNLIETTVGITNRIKNLDESIPHEEVSYICDRILGQFNNLTPENQTQIAKYVATLGETGYEHLHKLFQTIGDTQHLPNYFAPEPMSPRTLLNRVMDSVKNFTNSPGPENIINLGIKTREWVDLSKESPIYFSYLEEGIQNQILSHVNHSVKTQFNSTSKHGIAKLINSQDYNISELGINSVKELIEYLGPNCVHVKKLNTGLFNQPVSKDLLLEIQQAFPNLLELSTYNLDDSAAEVLKNFKSLRTLLIENSPALTDKKFLENFSSLSELYLSNTKLEEIDAQSLHYLTELKILNCPELKTIENAQNLKSLTKLLISDCKKTDLNFLGEIPNLTKASITYMNDVNLSSLANHPYLEHLYLERSNIENFDFLFTLSALKYLDCSNSVIPEKIEHELDEKGVIVTNNS